MGVQCMGPGIFHLRLWKQKQLENITQRMFKQLRVQFSFSRLLLSCIMKIFQRRYFYEQLKHHLRQLSLLTINFFSLTKKTNGMHFPLDKVFKFCYHSPWSKGMNLATYILCIHWYICGVEIGCHNKSSKKCVYL